MRNCLENHKLTDCVSKKTTSAMHVIIRLFTTHTAKPRSRLRRTSRSDRWRNSEVAVLLATARVRVADKYGTLRSVRALVDQGSELSLVSERVAQLLKLPRESTTVTVFEVGGRKTGVAKGSVSLKLISRIGGQPIKVSALVLPQLTSYASNWDLSPRDWPYLHGLELADPDFQAADAINLLLGAEIYAIILKEGLRKGNAWGPVAQNTALKWILSRQVEDATTVNLAYTHQCQVSEDLNKNVRRF